MLGTLNINPREMAEAILQAINDYINMEKPRNLKLIRLVIFDQQMVQLFIKSMEKLVHEKKGLWGETNVFPVKKLP